MKRESLLTIAVIALLLLNFSILGFLFFRRPPLPPKGNHGRIDRQIIEKLALNPEQVLAFEQLKLAHQKLMEKSNRDYRFSLEHYFDLLKQDSIIPREQDSLETVLMEIHRDRAQATLQHFKALKALCKPEQGQYFEALIPELMGIMLPKPPPDRRPGNQGE